MVPGWIAQLVYLVIPVSLGSDPICMSSVSFTQGKNSSSIINSGRLYAKWYLWTRRWYGVKGMMVEPKLPQCKKCLWSLGLVGNECSLRKLKGSLFLRAVYSQVSFSLPWRCLVPPSFFLLKYLQESQERRTAKQTKQAGADLSILSDGLVIFYNLIRLIAEWDNESVTYKIGLGGGIKSFLAQDFSRP